MRSSLYKSWENGPTLFLPFKPYDQGAIRIEGSHNTFSICWALDPIPDQIAVGRSAAADNAEPGFFYVIRGVMADEFSDVNGIAVRQERYVESTINLEISANPMPTAAGYCVLNISTLRNRFLTSLTGSATAA